MNNQITFDAITKPKFKISKPIRLIELFAGIGAQAKALENLGIDFEHYRICEFDKNAVKSYNAIHGTAFTPSDITKLSGDDLGITDTDRFTYLLTYSFPCQDLSLAGKQRGMSKGDNTRSGLLWEVERLLNETKELPQILLMENVIQVHSKKNKSDFVKWISFLESKGYTNYWQDLNAKDYGVAQNRNRCFMISILGDFFYEFPKKETLTKVMRDYLEPEVDDKYFLSDKGAYYVSTKGRKKCNFNADISSTILTSIGSNWRGSFVTENNKIRNLTPRECFRLMTFSDDDFDKCRAAGMSDCQLYKQAGNSIVVSVLEKILKELF